MIKDCCYIVSMMFLFLFTGRWTEFGLICQWLVTGKVEINEVDFELYDDLDEELWK